MEHANLGDAMYRVPHRPINHRHIRMLMVHFMIITTVIGIADSIGILFWYIDRVFLFLVFLYFNGSYSERIRH